MILEIVTKEYPYAECTNQAQIYKKVTSGVRPQALQKVLQQDTRSFIELCLTFDPKDRPSAQELLSHPFLQFEQQGSVSSINLSETTSISTDPTVLANGTADSVIVDSPKNSEQEFPSRVPMSQASLPETTVVDAENHTFLILERPSLKQAQPLTTNESERVCLVEFLDRPTEDEVTLKMVYGYQKGPVSEIRFPFKLSEDTATDVVSEMIKESLIMDQDEQLARRKLEEAIRIVLLDQIRFGNVESKYSSSNRPTPVPSPQLAPSSAVNTPDHNLLSMPSFQTPNGPRTSPMVQATQPNPLQMMPIQLPASVTQTRAPYIDASSNPSDPMQTDSSYIPLAGAGKLNTQTPVMDPAVQSRLRELQELNLKGLGSLGINPSNTANQTGGILNSNVRHTSSRSHSYTNLTEHQPWPVTFGQSSGNGHLPPARTHTMPPIHSPSSAPNMYPQGGGTLPRAHHPLIPRSTNPRPTDTAPLPPLMTPSFGNPFSNSQPSNIPPRHARSRSISSNSNMSVMTAQSSETTLEDKVSPKSNIFNNDPRGAS